MRLTTLAASLLVALCFTACVVSPPGPGPFGGRTKLEVIGTVGPTVDEPLCLEVDSMVIDMQPVLMLGRIYTAYREDGATFVCGEASNPCWYYMELRDQTTDEITEYFYLAKVGECDDDPSLTCDSRLEPDGQCEPFLRWVVMLAYVWKSVRTWDNATFQPACMSMGWDIMRWEFTHPQMDGTWQIKWGRPGSPDMPTFSCQ